MRVFRISKSKFIRDLSGTGARLYGGRWNEKGVPVIYTAENRSLATVEYLVHTSFAIQPRGLSIATLEMPDTVSLTTVLLGDLPDYWRSYPAPPELSEIGANWTRSNVTSLLCVPSAVVPEEYNVLINPLHPEMKYVKILAVDNYEFDQRLLRNEDRIKPEI